jgi:uncharacterized protein YrrD
METINSVNEQGEVYFGWRERIMKNAREVVGMHVMDLSEGGSIGRVKSLVFNPSTRRVKALEVGERSLFRKSLKQVSFSAIRSFGSDKVTLHSFDAAPEDNQAQDTTETQGKMLAGKRLITVDGTLVGTVDDFSFSTENGELFYLYVVLEKTGEYLNLPVTSVEHFGHDDIVISDDYLEHSTKIYFMKREQPSTVKIKELQQNL